MSGNDGDHPHVDTNMFRRTLAGLAAIVILLGVLVATSGFRPTATGRMQPSEAGMEQQNNTPFEFGPVNNSQSVR